ncbi:T9SS type A sorting domain-containing protein [Dyadobacter sp. CY351]|uniref:T9SS type A sorting domain-containing protein n=1 Tax=Dyadobacter sp. CY351 TaxID=2909337 RepID=UPI001F4233DF|nr:T9SS type A sorting domain-containing protein [Dyadobacter sp. CY351]MCF2516366.1 T9SS type A sorting domain-containing protein [Dyadobacter sp. CY351]
MQKLLKFAFIFIIIISLSGGSIASKTLVNSNFKSNVGAPTVQFLSYTSAVNEGEAKNVGNVTNPCLPYVDKIVTVTISQDPSLPVTVSFNPSSGTATEGSTGDYTIIPNSFNLEAGNLSKDVIVRVYNDGYVEGDETIKLTYNLATLAGGDAVHNNIKQQHTITIVDDDFPPSSNGSINILYNDFNSKFNKLPGWQVVGGGGYPKTWEVMDFGPGNGLDPNGTPYLGIDGWQSGGYLDKVIETPSFNSLGMSSINLSYLEYFGIFPGDFDSRAIIDVWDGSVWQNLLTQNTVTGNSGSFKNPFKRSISIPLAYSNIAMKLRFRYVAGAKHVENVWLIDNFKISGTHHTTIKNGISLEPAQQYLGPFATTHFFDPVTGDLILKIQNFTAQDYGCTWVEVDRAGQDETTWFGAHKITNKTFKVIPTNNNPNGKYEITLYYRASELPNFNGAAIKSMGKTEPEVQQATLANSISEPVQLSMFNSDFAYTATFNSGFGGFGVSDAPAGDALPVTLSKFEGKSSVEGNVLFWETASEVNSDFFIVERSIDAKAFFNIKQIPCAGTSQLANRYAFTDSNLKNQVYYYRLRQVDQDGTFAYSRIIKIDSPITSQVKFFPNPVRSWLDIELQEMDSELFDVSIVNASGQVVWIGDKNKCQNGKLRLDLSRLTDGIYQVVVSATNYRQIFKIAKIQ